MLTDARDTRSLRSRTARWVLGLDFRSSDVYSHTMPVVERTLSDMLRNSGEVIEEAALRDVILRRRDGDDLFLALRSRERAVRESLGVLARILRAALHDDGARAAVVKWAAEELPWTTLLPADEAEVFLADFARKVVACVETDAYEPLVHELADWKATAETHANREVVDALKERHSGPAVPLARPHRHV